MAYLFWLKLKPDAKGGQDESRGQEAEPWHVHADGNVVAGARQLEMKSDQTMQVLEIQ